MTEQHHKSVKVMRGLGFYLRALVLVVVVLFQFNAPPAHAFIVSDPGNTAQGALNVANTIITNANLILQQIQHALKSVIEMARERIKIEYQKSFNKATNAEIHRTALNNALLKINDEASISPATQACAIARSGAARDSAKDATSQFANFQGGLNARRGVAAGGAGNRTPGGDSADVDLACRAGLIGKDRYRGVRDRMSNCKELRGEDKDAYEDGDMRISSVLNPVHTSTSKTDPGALQYTLPDKADLRDGRIDFSRSSNLTGDELAFVTAYKFCENLMPDLPNPTSGDHLTIDDIVNIKGDRKNTAIRSAAADRCFASLRYRTACPRSTDGVFPGCYKAQKAMCTFLKTPAPNGLGLSDRPSLNNCEEIGLSEAEYDRIMATRCHDDGYVKAIHAILNAENAQHFVLFECPMLEMTYETRMDHERAALEQSIAALVSMRGVGSSASIGSRPVGGGPSGAGSVTP